MLSSRIGTCCCLAKVVKAVGSNVGLVYSHHRPSYVPFANIYLAVAVVVVLVDEVSDI